MTKIKTALVTGAAGDIGTDVAERLDIQGYRLILVDINDAKLAELSGRLRNAQSVVTNLSDREDLSNLLPKIEKEFGHIDMAFVNAGVVIVGDVLELNESEIDLQLEINLRSAMHLIKACAANMVGHGSGHIISTVSMGGIVSLKGCATYSASKFGLRGFLMALRDELKPRGVAVTGIYPSGVDTQMLRYEARNGGSNLNFVSAPLSVEKVGKAVMKSISTRRLEIYLPYSEGLSGRLVSYFPWLISYLYPILEWLGKRGLKRYLKTIEGI